MEMESTTIYRCGFVAAFPARWIVSQYRSTTGGGLRPQDVGGAADTESAAVSPSRTSTSLESFGRPTSTVRLAVRDNGCVPEIVRFADHRLENKWLKAENRPEPISRARVLAWAAKNGYIDAERERDRSVVEHGPSSLLI